MADTMGTRKQLGCSSILCLLLGGCGGLTAECPAISQWWYHARPDAPLFTSYTPTGIRHDPSTITSVGGHGNR